MTKTTALEKSQRDYRVPNIVDDLYSGIGDRAESVHLQPIRNLVTTIQIQDNDGSVVDTIAGKTTSGSISVTGDSLTRRTGNLEMVVDPKYLPSKSGSIWYGKLFKVYQGIVDMKTYPNEPINFLLGTFVVDEDSLSVSDASSSITIKLSDKMTQYDEETLENELKIPQGTPINVAMRKTMELLGETSFGYMYESSEDETVPYDYIKEVGSNVVDIIKELRDMYMDYICGYNIRGEFEFRKLDIQKSTDSIVPKWTFKPNDNGKIDLKLSFSETYNLKNVKNRIVVYGATNSLTGITPQGVVRLTDPKSPFNVDAIGTRTQIIVDSKLSNDMQCTTEAKYNIWKTAHFQEQCTLTCLPIYLLEANDIIEITNPVNGESYRYMIDNFSLDLGVTGQMTITAHKMYYIGLEYGDVELPIVNAIKKGINQMGWLSLGEQRIKDCYGISAAGTNTLVVRFTSIDRGGEQAAVTGYSTTKTQTMEFDLMDYQNLKLSSEDGDVGRSKGDYLDRILSHEMFHAVSNDYYGVSATTDMPTWFKEGFAELNIGGKDRYLSLNGFANSSEKKQHLVNKAKQMLDGYWESTSESYSSAFLIAAGIYFLINDNNKFKQMFTHIKSENNLNLNFLTKLLPLSGTNDELKNKLIEKVNNMPLWEYLNDSNDQDTCSIGGSHMMNIYKMPLDASNVFDENLATTDSLGFKIIYD